MGLRKLCGQVAGMVRAQSKHADAVLYGIMS